MSAHLPPTRLPSFLRILAWLYLVVVAAGIVAQVVRFAQGEPMRWTRLISAAFTFYGALQLRAGRREGLDTLLFVHVIGSIGVVVLLGFTDRGASVLQARPVLALAGAAFVIFVTGYFAWCRARLPWRLHEDDDADRDRIERQLALDREQPPDVRALLDDALDRGERPLALARLAAQGERATDAVCEAIDDRRFWRDTPLLGALVELVPQPAPVHAAGSLARACTRLDGAAQAAAFGALASTGDVEFQGAIVAGLVNVYTSSPTVQGLMLAYAAGRRTDELDRAIQEPLFRGIDSSDAAAAILITIDPQNATRFLDDFDVREPGRDRAIQIALARGAPVPMDRVRDAWEEALRAKAWHYVVGLLPYVGASDHETAEVRAQLAAGLDDYEARAAFVDWLTQLVDCEDPRAEAELRAAIELDREYVSEEAAAQLGRLFGLPGESWLFVDFRRELEPAARFHCALTYASSFASNGGIAHAFEALNEENAGALARALEAVGPPEVRDVWMRAIEIFAAGPLPESWNDRSEMLAVMPESKERVLDDLTDEFHAIQHRLHVQLSLFAIEHRDVILPVLDDDPDV